MIRNIQLNHGGKYVCAIDTDVESLSASAILVVKGKRGNLNSKARFCLRACEYPSLNNVTLKHPQKYERSMKCETETEREREMWTTPEASCKYIVKESKKWILPQTELCQFLFTLYTLCAAVHTHEQWLNPGLSWRSFVYMCSVLQTQRAGSSLVTCIGIHALNKL